MDNADLANYRPLSDLEGAEAEAHVARHLSVREMKPCAAAFLALTVYPKVGLREHTAYALAAELGRLGVERDRATSIIADWYRKLPSAITQAPGRDGRPFSESEALAKVRAVYWQRIPKSFGCKRSDNPLLAACVGEDACFFMAKLRGKRRAKDVRAAFYPWLGARDAQGRKLLSDSQVRLYYALEALEARRGFPPGARLYTSWRELAGLSGFGWQNVGRILEKLFWHGLITYQKGRARQRGIGTEVQRIIPIPEPETPSGEVQGLYSEVLNESAAQNKPISAAQNKPISAAQRPLPHLRNGHVVPFSGLYGVKGGESHGC